MFVREVFANHQDSMESPAQKDGTVNAKVAAVWMWQLHHHLLHRLRQSAVMELVILVKMNLTVLRIVPAGNLAGATDTEFILTRLSSPARSHTRVIKDAGERRVMHALPTTNAAPRITTDVT